MTTPSSQSGENSYGMGISRGRTPAGVCYGHSGFWGSVSFYCPRRRLAVSVAIDVAAPADPAEVAVALLAAAVER
jgi:hypothetical protein